MFFDEVRSYWKESFDFFKWQNLRLMLLASLNNFRRVAGIFATELWFFVIVLFCLQAFEVLNSLGVFSTENYSLGVGYTESPWTAINFLVPIYLQLGSFLGLFFFLLAVRPSVERKDDAYFLKYMFRFFGVMLILAFIPAYLLPLQVVSILFLVDLPGSFRSFFSAIKNGLLLCIYFLPAIIGLSVCSLVPHFLFRAPLSDYVRFIALLTHKLASTQSIVLVVVLPVVIFLLSVAIKALLIAICVMYYVKIKHSHHRLFFSN